MKEIRIIIITGLSGAGKSTALNILEDMGYYCVDNLPSLLLPSFIEMSERSEEEIKRVGIVMDAREKDFFPRFPEILKGVKGRGYQVSLIFLEAENDVLKRRFQITRRPHPYRGQLTLEEGIEKERADYGKIREMADICIDTGDMAPRDLKLRLSPLIDTLIPSGVNINIISFGFVHEPPRDADVIMDVRFIPNPYFQESLRPLPGTDRRIKGFLRNKPVYRDFLKVFKKMLSLMVEEYLRMGKNYVTIAVGCTGGKHRSPAAVEDIAAWGRKRGYNVSLFHRDIDK